MSARAYIDDELRNHRISEQRDAEGWEPQDVRDLAELDLFDGQIHRLYDDDMPVALGLLCEAMPTAAEDAAFAGETGDLPIYRASALGPQLTQDTAYIVPDDAPDCLCGSGLLATENGECICCWWESQP